MRTKLIFAENPRRFNVDGALQYGEPMNLASFVHPLRLDEAADEMERTLKLHPFDPAKDIVVLTGTVVAVAIMMATIRKFTQDYIRCLVFDAKTNMYMERILP